MIVLPFHIYPAASAVFWKYSIIPSVGIPTGIMVGAITLLLLLRAITAPIFWLVERFLRRTLESERGVMSVIAAGLTGIGAIVNTAVRAEWF